MNIISERLKQQLLGLLKRQAPATETIPIEVDVGGSHYLHFDAIDVLATEKGGFEVRLLWRGEVMYSYEHFWLAPGTSLRL